MVRALLDRFSTKIKEQYGLLKSFQDRGKAGTYKVEETVNGSLPRRRQDPKHKCDRHTSFVMVGRSQDGPER